MTETERVEILRRYVDGEVSAERTADRLGVGVADVILETKARFGRLPDRDDAFTRGEYRRALALLGLTASDDEGGDPRWGPGPL